MTARNFLTEILARKTRVQLTRSIPLGEEIKKQLAAHAEIQVVETGDADVIVHLAGFTSPTLAETLYHTSTLHQWLDRAMQTRAKFVLVIPQSNAPLVDVATTLVAQFGRNFGLNYKIVSLPGGQGLAEMADEVVRSFVYQHRHRPTIVRNRPTSPPSAAIKVSFGWSWLGPVAGLILIWYGLWFTQLWGLARAAHCAYTTWDSRCNQAAQILLRTLDQQTRLLPGGAALLARWGYPWTETRRLIGSLDEGLRLADRLPKNLEELPQWAEWSPYLLEYLTRVQAQLQEFAVSSARPPVWVDELTNQLAGYRQLAAKLQPIAADIPTWLSLQGRTSYLILVHDNTELRPGGGFVGQIGWLVVDKGEIESLEWWDTSATDAQLRGQIPPPESLRQALRENSWYLRDVSWEADFPTNAAKANWFLQKELGRSADWVVGVNLNTLSALLHIVGSAGEVTAQNLVSKYLSNIQPSASPSFVLTVLQALQPKLSQLSASQTQALTQLVLTGLENRQIQAFPLTTGTAKSLAQLGWDGRLNLTFPCRTQTACLADGLYVVDSNIGVNKVNPYVQRQTRVQHVLQTKQLESTYQITYTHTGNQSAWPYGPYRNFLRVYLPSTTSVKRVMVNGRVLPAGEYQTNARGGALEISLSVEAPVGQSVPVEIQTIRPLLLTGRWHYQLDVPNQPGMGNDQLLVTVVYPKEWWVGVYQTPAVASLGRVEYNTSLSRPYKLDIDFSATP